MVQVRNDGSLGSDGSSRVVVVVVFLMVRNVS